jgi:KipI family sensor histidine kinase inhibitor
LLNFVDDPRLDALLLLALLDIVSRQIKSLDATSAPRHRLFMNSPPSPPPKPRFLACGDTALAVEFGTAMDADSNRRVFVLDRALKSAPVEGIIETVPTYRSLLVHYDPLTLGFSELSDRLLRLLDQPDSAESPPRHWRVPVAYGGTFGLDLEEVARIHDMSSDELIRRHTAPRYDVAMLGFTPGFSYLRGLDPAIATPRRAQPRISTSPGTISIGGIQAALQCLAGPSAWHLFGRTPVRTFDPRRNPAFLIEPGDTVTFERIDAAQFERLDRLAERGETVAELMA